MNATVRQELKRLQELAKARRVATLKAIRDQLRRDTTAVRKPAMDSGHH
jgi:hypothetical protein